MSDEHNEDMSEIEHFAKKIFKTYSFNWLITDKEKCIINLKVGIFDKNGDTNLTYCLIYIYLANQLQFDLSEVNVYTPSSIVHGMKLERSANYIAYGNKCSRQKEFLFGKFITSNGRFYLSDSKTTTRLYINTGCNSNFVKHLNQLVVIDNFHVLSEMYYDGYIECIFTEPGNVKALTVDDSITMPEIVTFDCKASANYTMHFELIAHTIIQESNSLVIYMIGILLPDVNSDSNKQQIALQLGSHYLPKVAFMNAGDRLTIYSMNKWIKCLMHQELYRVVGRCDCYKYLHEDALFWKHENLNHRRPIIHKDVPKAKGLCNVQAIIQGHYLNPPRSSRTSHLSTKTTGLLGRKYDHRLALMLSSRQSSMYLNNWECKLQPEGLHPGSIVIISNVDYTGSYFKSNILTDIKVIGVDYTLRRYSSATLGRNIGCANYASIMLARECFVKYPVYMRSKVQVMSMDIQVDTQVRGFAAIFNVMDESGYQKLYCDDYDILYKLGGIPEEHFEAYDLLSVFTKPINLSNIDAIAQNRDLQEQPFAYDWFLRNALVLQSCMTLDILWCKSVDNSFIILDVYGVNT